MSNILLEVNDIYTYYGPSCVIRGLSLYVKNKEIVALLGRNGNGKTTTLRSIMSLNPPKRGSIWFDGKNITGLPPHKCARLGLSLCLEGRGIFPGLSVMENLRVPVCSDNQKELLKQVFEIFPELESRKNQRAGSLSGGEQQMLAIARSLMMKPKLLLLDEPMEGLAPMICKRLISKLREINMKGVTILFSSSTAKHALDICDRVYIIEKGKIVAEYSKKEMEEKSSEILQKYLGVVR